MGRSLRAAVAMTGLFALTALNASAAPSSDLSGVHAALSRGGATNVDYDWHHHHYHHRRWEHGHWRHWN